MKSGCHTLFKQDHLLILYFAYHAICSDCNDSPITLNGQKFDIIELRKVGEIDLEFNGISYKFSVCNDTQSECVDHHAVLKYHSTFLEIGQ